jgi:hypothetical protein
MKKLNVNTIPRGDLHVIHYPAKELKKKLQIVAPDIYVLADKDNNWISAGYTEDANLIGGPDFVLSWDAQCNHYNPERFHRLTTINCVAFMLREVTLANEIFEEITGGQYAVAPNATDS